MSRSTHPAIAVLSDDELLAEGCCEGMEAARAWSGLSLNELYDLMNTGVLPTRLHKKARLVPKVALRIVLKDIFNDPAPEPTRQPPRPRPIEAAARG